MRVTLGVSIWNYIAASRRITANHNKFDGPFSDGWNMTDNEAKTEKYWSDKGEPALVRVLIEINSIVEFFRVGSSRSLC